MQPSVFLLSSAACAMKILFLPSYLPWVFIFFSPGSGSRSNPLSLFLARFSFLSFAPTTKPDCPVYCKPLISAEQVPRSCLPWLFRTTAALAPGGGGRGERGAPGGGGGQARRSPGLGARSGVRLRHPLPRGGPRRLLGPATASRRRRGAGQLPRGGGGPRC